MTVMCKDERCPMYGAHVAIPQGDTQICESCDGYMSPAAADVLSPAPVGIAHFEGQPLLRITHQGRPAWVAREIGRVLGYAYGGRSFLNLFSTDWSEELIPGQDFVIVEGSDLADMKRLITDSVMSGQDDEKFNSLSSRAPSLMLLYETGLHLVCLLSKKPAGVRLRRWLATQVLPSISRGVPPGATSAPDLRAHPHFGLRLPPELQEVGALLDLYERMKSLDMPGEALAAISTRITAVINPRPTLPAHFGRRRPGPSPRYLLRFPGETDWMSCSELASRAGIRVRNARIVAQNAMMGRPWRGMVIEVKHSSSNDEEVISNV